MALVTLSLLLLLLLLLYVYPFYWHWHPLPSHKEVTMALLSSRGVNSCGILCVSAKSGSWLLWGCVAMVVVGV